MRLAIFSVWVLGSAFPGFVYGKKSNPVASHREKEKVSYDDRPIGKAADLANLLEEFMANQKAHVADRENGNYDLPKLSERENGINGEISKYNFSNIEIPSVIQDFIVAKKAEGNSIFAGDIPRAAVESVSVERWAEFLFPQIDRCRRVNQSGPDLRGHFSKIQHIDSKCEALDILLAAVIERHGKLLLARSYNPKINRLLSSMFQNYVSLEIQAPESKVDMNGKYLYFSAKAGDPRALNKVSELMASYQSHARDMIQEPSLKVMSEPVLRLLRESLKVFRGSQVDNRRAQKLLSKLETEINPSH